MCNFVVIFIQCKKIEYYIKKQCYGHQYSFIQHYETEMVKPNNNEINHNTSQ
jgi:hypothetical protein